MLRKLAAKVPLVQQTGFMDSSGKNLTYARFLEDEGCQVELSEAGATVQYTPSSQVFSQLLLKKSPMWLVRREDLPASTKADVVLAVVFRGLSVQTVAEDYRLSEQAVKNIIYEYKSLRGRKLGNLTHADANFHKLQKSHLEWLAAFLDCKKEEYLTISLIRNQLLIQFRANQANKTEIKVT